MLKKILDFLFPIHCVGCKQEKTHCCVACMARIPQIYMPPVIACNTIYAASSLKNNAMLSTLIHRFKYEGAKEISKHLISLFQKMPQAISENPVLVPVPLHKRRLNMRGFNQSMVLSKEINKKWHIEISDILERHRYTRPQVELSGAKRLTNIVDAFSIKNNAEKIDPEKLYIIVDDVYTTGATLGQCAKVLKKNGARHVAGLVIAKA